MVWNSASIYTNWLQQHKPHSEIYNMAQGVRKI